MRFAPSAALAAIVALTAIPTTASAGCANCYTPPPCPTCYRQVVEPPQYRTRYDTVMVNPGRVIERRTPARYETVMVPRTVLVEPERVYRQRIEPEYAVVPRVEVVSPPRAYYVPVRPRCGNCW